MISSSGDLRDDRLWAAHALVIETSQEPDEAMSALLAEVVMVSGMRRQGVPRSKPETATARGIVTPGLGSHRDMSHKAV